MAIRERAKKILAGIADTADKCGRDPSEVSLVAVSKTKPVSMLMEAYEAGLRIFGENYVQEAVSKMDELPGDIEWHMIGHLQSNKAKYVVGNFDLVHTVDRPSLAKELNRLAEKRGLKVPILLQANLAGENTKAGTDDEGAVILAKRAEEWPSLEIRGLMCIPPYDPDPESSRPHFRALKELAEKIDDFGLESVSMDTLSMGMSHDYRVAIEEGATLVRVGSAIFGERG